MFLSTVTSLNSTAQTFLEREKGKNNVSFHLTSPIEESILPVVVCSSPFYEALSSPRCKSTQDHVIHLVYELDKLP